MSAHGTRHGTGPLRCLRPALLAGLLLASLALALAGCGGSGGNGGNGGTTPSGRLTRARRSATASLDAVALPRRTQATLVLDYQPNAVHAGIYRALAAGYYTRVGIDLRVIQPASTDQTLRLIDAGKADFGLADGIDVAQLIDAGGDARAIMAITQAPLGGLIALASEHLRSPRDLDGRTVGVTGVPSDSAVLDTEVRHAGGDPRRVRVVDVGFNGAAALLAGHIAAFTGYWPADGVALQVAGHPITVFTLDGNGGPRYPGLLAFSTRRRLAADSALARAFVAATVRGYEDVIADPALGLNALLRLNPTLSRPLAEASLHRYESLFVAGGVPFGTLSDHALQALSDWLVLHRLIRHQIAPQRMATGAFLPR